MRKASASIIIGLVSFLCLAVPSFGMLDMKNGEADLSQEGLTQVDFIDPNGVTTTEYFNPGDVLSLGDAPGVKYNNAFYTWKSDTGLYLHDHVTVGGERLTFRTENPQSVTLENWYLEEYTKGNPERVNTSINTSGSGIKKDVYAGLDIAIDFSTPLVNCYNSSSGTQAQYVYQNEYDSWLVWEDHDASWLASSFSGGYPYLTRGEETKENSFPNGPFANTKSSIGLETHPADYPNGADMDTAYNQYYKPVNLQKRTDLGDQVSDLKISEYCFARFTLQNDVILSGNFTLGALTGFARQDESDTSMNLQWTQLNSQGFICGPYSELDLNGYDLILESGSMIDAFGSITDSSSERDGRLILKSGATMYSTFVFEDMWRENSIPEIYAGGMDWMQMFRCPYLDCEIVFEAGCNFYGKLYISFGKNQGSIHTDLHIIGSHSSSAWIRLSSGSIIRKMDYNKELYNTLVKAHGTDYTGLTNDRAYKDVTYQKIKYYFVNANVEVCEIATNMSITIVGTSLDISITSYRYQKWIPPYYDFYSYGSTIRLHQEYVFMPGCYLYADSRTTIFFDYGSGSIGDFIDSIAFNYMTYADNQKTNCAAGLVLVQNYYNSDIGNVSTIHITKKTDDVDIYVDSKERKGWYDTRKSDGNSNSNEGHGVWTWGSRSRFWNYYAEIPARFDCYAKLEFTSGNAVPYVLGGEINFPSKSAFDSYISGASVQLWGSVAMSGPSTGALACDLHQINIASLYSCPLISNGEIWTPLENGSGLTNTYYNRKTGLINARNGSSNVYYAFIYDDPAGKAEHVYYAYNGSGGGTTNSLSGQWRQVTYSNNIATYNGSTYAFYQGGFMPYRSSDSSIKLNKFAGFDNSTNGSGTYYLCRSVTYNSSSGWTITGQVQPW